MEYIDKDPCPMNDHRPPPFDELRDHPSTGSPWLRLLRLRLLRLRSAQAVQAGQVFLHPAILPNFACSRRGCIAQAMQPAPIVIYVPRRAEIFTPWVNNGFRFLHGQGSHRFSSGVIFLHPTISRRDVRNQKSKDSGISPF